MTEAGVEVELGRLRGDVAELERQFEAQQKHWHRSAIIVCFCVSVPLILRSTLSLFFGIKLDLADFLPFLIFLPMPFQVPLPRHLAGMTFMDRLKWPWSRQPAA
jgi:hypothetical protein